MLQKDKLKCGWSYHAYSSQGSFTCTYTEQHTTAQGMLYNMYKDRGTCVKCDCSYHAYNS